MRYRLFVFLLFLPLLHLHAMTYEIHATLDPTARTVRGSEEITWTNGAAIPAETLRFHLYQNAFASNTSTFAKEASWLKNVNDRMGSIEVTDLRIAGGDPLTTRFISPDDGNEADKTVLEALLPSPIPPGGSVKIHVEWITRLHKLFMRSGYSRTYHQVMQWYPKLGVWTDAGWNCHQFHAFTEFFADFADYDVTLQIPSSYTLACTGKILERHDGDGETAWVRIRQEKIHDFAFVCGEDLEETVVEYTPKGSHSITVRLYMPGEFAYQKTRRIEVLKKAFDFYNEWVGPYPYSHFSVVAPPWHATHGRGGMEYPTLIIAGTHHFIPGSSIWFPYVVAHEFGHQYFYGVLASNEMEEPWLDEGFTAYTSATFTAKHYNPAYTSINVFDLPVVLKTFPGDAFTKITRRYFTAPRGETMATPGWTKSTWSSYRLNAYTRPARALNTMQHAVGEEKMKAFLHAYYKQWAFKHPSGKDVVALIREKIGDSWGDFFQTLLKTTNRVDIRVASVTPRTVLIRREGPPLLPVTVELNLSDGRRILRKWEGKSHWVRFRYHGEGSILSARVDPENTFLLDEDPTNNSLSRKPERATGRRFAARLLFWVQNLMEAVSCVY